MNDETKKPNDTESVRDESVKVSGEPHLQKFVGSGILLFIDQLLIATGGWIFWLVISRFATTSEIGHATTVYSLVLLVNTIIQFGFEYPLLKKSAMHRRQIFGTAIMLELSLAAISIPIILYSIQNLQVESSELAWLAAGILVFSSISFISRFALLGVSNARTILIFDATGTIAKFVSGFVLVLSGYGAWGILLSFLFQTMIAGGGMLIYNKRIFGYSIGDFKFIREILKDGLTNLPSKLSTILIISLSVVLLATFGIESSEIGIFYIAMMMSVMGGSFAGSLAFMSLPNSSSGTDVSASSLRIGLSFTSLIIVLLVVAPTSILSIIGTEYVSASEPLVILAYGVLPSVIIANAMSQFNKLNEPKKLISIGSVRISIFLVSFLVLVPQFGTLGAAYSMLISFTSSALLSLSWMGRQAIRYVAISLLAILTGMLSGQAIEFVFGQALITIIVSLIITFCIVLLFRCISIREIRGIISLVK